MEQISEYAPIKIHTLNRFKHLRKCIESLQKNKGSDKTDLYIAVDYPPSEKYVDGYKKVCEYLSHPLTGFRTVNIIYRDHNYGALENSLDLYNRIFEKYETIISLEDDNELSPNFLEYCNKCLSKFKDDDDVIAINASNYVWCGSGMAPSYLVDSNNIKKRKLLFHAFATWKDKALKVKNWCESGMIIEECFSIQKMFKLYRTSKCFFCTYVDNVLWFRNNLPWHNDRLYCIDQVWDYYMIFYDKYVIYPDKAKTRDLGCDGSGVDFTEKFLNMNDILSVPLDDDAEFEFQINEPIQENKYELFLHDKFNYTMRLDHIKRIRKYILIRFFRKRKLKYEQ